MYLIKINVDDMKILAKQSKPFLKRAGKRGARVAFFSDGGEGSKLTQVVCEYDESVCFEPDKKTIARFRFESMLYQSRDTEVPKCSTTVAAFEGLVNMAKGLTGVGSATLRLDADNGEEVHLLVYSGAYQNPSHSPGHLVVSTKFDG
jgi:hypothetical protein